MTIPYNIFLDDLRNQSDVIWINYPVGVSWDYVRDYSSFVQLITRKSVLPHRISFDSDLCAEHHNRYLLAKANQKYTYEGLQTKTGYHALEWLIKYCEQFQKQLPEIFLHTQNEYALEDMRHIINDFRAKKNLQNLMKIPVKYKNENNNNSHKSNLSKTQKIVHNLVDTHNGKVVVMESKPKKLDIYIGEE